MISIETTTCPTVIPAKAGIQLNTSCEALKTNNVCCARVLDWIPAFAGMTGGRCAP